MLRKAHIDHSEIRALLGKDTKRRVRFADAVGPCEWWHHYEQSPTRHIATACIDIGLIAALPRLLLSKERPSILDPKFDLALENLEVNPRSTRKGMAAAYSIWATMMSVHCFGEPIYDLVRRADRDDRAMLNAIQIDASAIHCAPCRRRLSRAVLQLDSEFLQEVGNAIANPKPPEAVQYGELTVCLFILRSMRQLHWLTESLAEELFLVRLADLNLYGTKTSPGDRRNLIRFVQRYRSKTRDNDLK